MKSALLPFCFLSHWIYFDTKVFAFKQSIKSYVSHYHVHLTYFLNNYKHLLETNCTHNISNLNVVNSVIVLVHCMLKITNKMSFCQMKAEKSDVMIAGHCGRPDWLKVMKSHLFSVIYHQALLLAHKWSFVSWWDRMVIVSLWAGYVLLQGVIKRFLRLLPVWQENTDLFNRYCWWYHITVKWERSGHVWEQGGAYLQANLTQRLFKLTD